MVFDGALSAGEVEALYDYYAIGAYNYDAVGNRSTSHDGTAKRTYTSNSLNQYSYVDSTGYSYDNNGNLTGDGNYTYNYDSQNRLIEVESGGSAIAKYYYDYAGRRIAKVTGSVTTTYCYDGDQVIAEYENAALKRKFIYGPGIDEPVCLIDVNGQTETFYYYHYDGLGSVVALSDENSDIVERYEYDVFGKPTIWDADKQTNYTESQYDNPYMFTGRRYDDETSIYYYRARYYKSEIGRFLQTDPIGYIVSYMGLLNMYTYAGNNPSTLVDPYGLQAEDPATWRYPWGNEWDGPTCNAYCGARHFLGGMVPGWQDIVEEIMDDFWRLIGNHLCHLSSIRDYFQCTSQCAIWQLQNVDAGGNESPLQCAGSPWPGESWPR